MQPGDFLHVTNLKRIIDEASVSVGAGTVTQSPEYTGLHYSLFHGSYDGTDGTLSRAYRAIFKALSQHAVLSRLFGFSSISARHLGSMASALTIEFHNEHVSLRAAQEGERND